MQTKGLPTALPEVYPPGAARRRPDHARAVYPASGVGIGVDAGADVSAPPPVSGGTDHFAEQNGQLFAGTHLLLDFWGADRLDDVEHIERAMRQAVEVSGATLLHLHLHRFGGGGGVTGVAVLSESHISVHTWPERGFAAFDVFMCGGCRPDLAAEALRNALEPARVEVSVERRGVVA